MGFTLPFSRKKGGAPEEGLEGEKANRAASAIIGEDAARDAGAKAEKTSRFSRKASDKKEASGVKPEKGAKRTKTKGVKAPKISKRTCFVLAIGDEGGILTYIEKGVVARRLFAPSSERQHLAPLLELMRNHPKAPIFVLCDMMDQSYVRHALPPVSSLSVKKLVTRRMQRDFAPEDITGSISLGKDKDGRKEWHFMLISLANTSALQQWIEPVIEMPNSFKGIYLIPVEAGAFIELLSALAVPASDAAKPAMWKVMVLHDKVGGFRQVVLKNKQLIFTRLTQYAPDAPAEVTAGNIEQELQNTIEYLRRLDYDESDGLELYMVIGQELRDLIDVRKVSASVVKMFVPFEVAQIMGLPQAALSGDRFADVVLSASFGLLQKPKLPLMTAYAKKIVQLEQMQMGVMAVAALAALYMLYASVVAAIGWQSVRSEASEIMEKQEPARAELERAKRRFESLGSDQTKIMEVATLSRKAPQFPSDPLDFITRFAAIKGRNVSVMKWDWVYNDAAAISAATSAGKPAGMYTYKITLKFENHNNNRNILAQNAKAFADVMKARFEGYDVAFDDLPGSKEGEQEKVVIDFNKPVEEDLKLTADEDIVEVVLTGPLPPKEGAP